MSTYTPIASQTLGSAAASVTFSSIPQGYTDLVVVASLQTTAVTDRVIAQFNNDTGNNYSWTRILGNGSSATSNRYSNQNGTEIADYAPNSGSNFLASIINIQNYSNSTTYKTNLVRYNNADYVTVAVAGLWRNTNPITSITLVPTSGGSNFKIGSTFTLYGIAAA